MSQTDIKIPNDLDKALRFCLDQAESGNVVPLQKLLEKFTSQEDQDKILAHYPYIQRVQINTTCVLSNPAEKEAKTKSFVLSIAAVVLSVSFLGIVAAICWLSITDRPIPSTLNSLAAMLIGYVGGIVTGILGIKIKEHKGLKSKK